MKHQTKIKKRYEKQPYFVTFILGNHIYQNLYHEAVSFAIGTPLAAPNDVSIVELNLYLEKPRFEDLQKCIKSGNLNSETPGCICLANNTQYGFRGLPRIIAYNDKETENNGKGVLVKLKYTCTDVRYVK
jgi:hypothetical protein